MRAQQQQYEARSVLLLLPFCLTKHGQGRQLRR
jgi:hypothetical protein